MSTVKANNHQIGQSGTATNNFTLYQPSTPDGTVRLAVGNSGATTGDVLSVSNTGLSVTGTLSATGNVSFDGGSFVFNESGADKDFRIEGDTEPNLFFTDASTDRVGIGTSSPLSKLHVNGDIRTDGDIDLIGGAGTPEIRMYQNSGNWAIQNSAGSLLFYDMDATATRVTVDGSGNLGLGVTPSGWGSGYKGLQVNSGLTLMGSSINGNVTANAYFDGTYWRFISNGYATTYYANYANNGSHVWGVTSSGTAGLGINGTSGVWTTAMTLDASGNLGVGTTTPGARLSVLGAPDATFNSQLIIGSSSGAAKLTFNPAISSGIAGLTDGSLAFYGNGANSERARITSVGNVGIGTTSPAQRLDVNGNSITRGDVIISNGRQYNLQTNVTTGFSIYDASGGITPFKISTSGNVSADGVYSATVGGTNRDVYVDNTGLIGYVSSTRASKTNITNITDANWLLQLNPVSFNYRKKDEAGNYTEEADGPIEFGLIAEDTEAIKPELCFYDDVDGKQELRGISYSKLITPMLKLLQEQQALITSLTARVAALEGTQP